MSNSTWDEQYRAGKEALPWDSDTPAPELVEYFKSVGSPPVRVLEIGCGTGTNAVWMAEQGSRVIATDISPTAIKIATEKALQAGVDVDFQVSDVVEKKPIPDASVDFAFDRGVYHVMAPDQRPIFIDRVHAALALADKGYWLCLAGSADQKRDPEQEGPPQLKASEIIDLAELRFELYTMERISFTMPDGTPHLAWKALFRKRDPR